MQLFYREFGTSEEVIIIAHGLYGASDNWATIARALSEKHRVIAVDLRNHGKSPHYPEHNYVLMAADLKELLVNLKITRASFIGHSMGGKVAMQFALTYPSMIIKLAVLDIAPKAYTTFKNYGVTTNNHTAILSAMLAVDFSELKSRREIENHIRTQIEDEAISNFLLKNIARKNDGGYEWKLNVKALSDNLNEILDGFSFNQLLNIKPFNGPTLFLRGENSNYFQDEDLHVARKLFPNAELSTIPNAGHWLHAEQPKLVLNSLAYFLE